MSELVINCNACQEKIAIPQEAISDTTYCPNCGQTLFEMRSEHGPVPKAAPVEPPSDPETDITYHCLSNGEPCGPYSREMIDYYVARGSLVESDQYLDPATQQWRQLSHLIPGLPTPPSEATTPRQPPSDASPPWAQQNAPNPEPAATVPPWQTNLANNPTPQFPETPTSTTPWQGGGAIPSQANTDISPQTWLYCFAVGNFLLVIFYSFQIKGVLPGEGKELDPFDLIFIFFLVVIVVMSLVTIFGLPKRDPSCRKLGVAVGYMVSVSSLLFGTLNLGNLFESAAEHKAAFGVEKDSDGTVIAVSLFFLLLTAYGALMGTKLGSQQMKEFFEANRQGQTPTPTV